ncbi:MAG: hypothetical protein WD669_08330 [Pirellulales bacterium]
MIDVLFRYERVDPTSWAYLASILVIALYFKFSRVWSVRNLDLVGLILLAPPLLLIKFGIDHAANGEPARLLEHVGYIWLFAINGLFMLRLLLDATMVRRPLLEPNLTAGGSTFLGVSLFLLLVANIVTSRPDRIELSTLAGGAVQGDQAVSESASNAARTRRPGFPLAYLLAHLSTQPRGNAELTSDNSDVGSSPSSEPAPSQDASSMFSYVHIIAIVSQLAIVVGLLLVGMRHFDNIKMGLAAATLYLLLPYTAMWSGNVFHALPGALLVWAVVFYRRPLLAGGMIGLAFGSTYYLLILFLLPLWISFYWHRGLARFVIGLSVMIGLQIAAMAYMTPDMATFFAHLWRMLDVRFLLATDGAAMGAWQFWHHIYQIPVLAAFVGLTLSLVLWPAQKNLGTLIAYSAAVMLGTQFWYDQTGGLALAWFLPLLLLTIFRPNLEDRLALAVVK